MAKGEANKENIIFAIEHCLLSDSTICEGCYQDGPGFMGITCKKSVIRDALALLKEQSKQRFFVDSDGNITPLPIQPQWISVKDRLPDRYKKVLTYGTDYGLQENWLIRAGEEISWSMGYHITHWMPLPKPPEEVEQDG